MGDISEDENNEEEFQQFKTLKDQKQDQTPKSLKDKAKERIQWRKEKIKNRIDGFKSKGKND